jgi:hypothetical protein
VLNPEELVTKLIKMAEIDAALKFTIFALMAIYSEALLA